MKWIWPGWGRTGQIWETNWIWPGWGRTGQIWPNIPYKYKAKFSSPFFGVLAVPLKHTHKVFCFLVLPSFLPKSFKFQAFSILDSSKVFKANLLSFMKRKTYVYIYLYVRRVYIYVYIYICAYICMCIYVYVCRSIYRGVWFMIL